MVLSKTESEHLLKKKVISMNNVLLFSVHGSHTRDRVGVNGVLESAPLQKNTSP